MRTVFIWLCLLSAPVAFSQSQLASQPRLIIFGDSLADTGKTFLATQGLIPNQDFYDSGRFTNGLTWIECFALQSETYPPLPSRIEGFNFAHGGVKVKASEPFKPSMYEQVS